MPLMVGTVITLSPRIPVGDAVGIVTRRLAADGVAVLAAATADRRQVSSLRRLRARLVTDPCLSVFYGDHLDGATYLTVCRAGEERSAAYFGDAKTGP
jgi:hypothetical protein